jgi:type II secretory ATPase GspE/PulE/Tfp pilus assembly ATPase PilB-like protein
MCIRYRIDGICRIAHQIAGTYKDAIVARLKIMSRLDIAERRRPQSGKILIRFENRKLEYRVEITPTVGGREDAVLRLLSSSKPIPLEEMGFSAPNLRVFRELLSNPYGVILCVGPTGSGKTTTLHSALGHINTPERKIWTAEDPVEITQPGLRQVQVHPKIGFSFPEALRSFLRADPDVIMIGEMRDLETAKIVIDASLTGHLVFSTLHTNSAAETISRLMEMGIDPINFAEALLGVLAQRLTRRLCPQCKRPYHPDYDEYRQLVEAYGEQWFLDHGLPPYNERLLLMRKAGCEACGNEGYKGRLAIHELLSGTPAMKALLKKVVPAEEIAALAMTEGMRTLRMDGIAKVFAGETDFEQVSRVCV